MSGATGGGLIPRAAADAAAARHHTAREQPAVALVVLKAVLIPIWERSTL